MNANELRIGNMVTESEIEEASSLWADDFDRTHDREIASLSHYEGAKWAILQLQAKIDALEAENMKIKERPIKYKQN